MRQDLNSAGIPAALHHLVAHKFCGGEQQVHTLAVGLQPLVSVGLSCENGCRCPTFGVTALCDYIPEAALGAAFARLSRRDQIVRGAQHLKIVQVVDNGDTLSPEFPENRRRKLTPGYRSVGCDRADSSFPEAPLLATPAPSRFLSPRLPGISGSPPPLPLAAPGRYSCSAKSRLEIRVEQCVSCGGHST